MRHWLSENEITVCLSAMSYVYIHNFTFRFTYDVGKINKADNVHRLQRNIKSRCWIHCYIIKAINITYSECVFVALVIQHAMSMRSICHLWPVRLYSIFPHCITNGTIFGKKHY
jgi:hypothetical protein